MALQGAQLLNEGEATSLLDLEKELKAQLSTAYQGCISLSSLPAFYAATDCLLPTNSHFKNQVKFLGAMDAQTMLEKSKFASFCRFISHEICKNYKEKIRKANLRKIRASIDDGSQLLDGLIKNFTNAGKNLEKQFKSTSSELDSLKDSIPRKIRSHFKDKLAQTKSELRQKIYSKIGDDLSNDAFKNTLEESIEKMKNGLVQALQGSLHHEIEDFEKVLKDVVMRFNKNSEEILDLNINRHFGDGPGSFVLDFKMDNGINTLGLISSLGGATAMILTALLSSNPLGWTVAAAIGAVTLIFSFYKSVRSFFSSEYKQEQQRKSANENISKVFDKIDEMLDERLSTTSNEMAEKINDVTQQLATPVHAVKNTLETLKATRKEIEKIAKNLA